MEKPFLATVRSKEGPLESCDYLEDVDVDVEVSALAGSLSPDVAPLSLDVPDESPDLEEVLLLDDFVDDDVSVDEDLEDEPPEGDVPPAPPDPPAAGAEGSLLLPAPGVADVGTSFTPSEPLPSEPPLPQPARSPIASSAAAVTLTHFNRLFIPIILLSPFEEGYGIYFNLHL